MRSRRLVVGEDASVEEVQDPVFVAADVVGGVFGRLLVLLQGHLYAYVAPLGPENGELPVLLPVVAGGTSLRTIGVVGRRTAEGGQSPHPWWIIPLALLLVASPFSFILRRRRSKGRGPLAQPHRNDGSFLWPVMLNLLAGLGGTWIC